jgi:N-acetylglucosamine kinase-like BadF-type ATPase
MTDPVHVLGIDVGGTKTVALLGGHDGRTVATARGPGANFQIARELELQEVLRSVIDEAAAEGGARPSAICLGIAGVDRPADADIVRRIVRRIEPGARVLVVNDALIALEAAVGDAQGVVIVAGTGSIAYGRNGRGEAARAGGWGYVLGDEGSGYWIGRLALRAIVRQADGRGRATSLTRLVLAHFHLGRTEELIETVYHQGLAPAAVAALATFVQLASDDGDGVAAAILARGAEELASAAASVTAQLDIGSDSFPFVLAGGIFKALPGLRNLVADLLPAIAARSSTVHLEGEPALGAVRLALAELQGGARVPTYRR